MWPWPAVGSFHGFDVGTAKQVFAPGHHHLQLFDDGVSEGKQIMEYH